MSDLDIVNLIERSRSSRSGALVFETEIFLLCFLKNEEILDVDFAVC